jgi:hypothetical protein
MSTEVKRDQIILRDESKYQEDVPLIRNSDAPQITSEETQTLYEIQITSVEPILRDGSEFSEAKAMTQTAEEVRDIYRNICQREQSHSCVQNSDRKWQNHIELSP